MCREVKGQTPTPACLYTGRSIYVANTETGQVQELTTGNAPVWSPDGTEIAFLSNRSGAPEVWMVNVAGGDDQQLSFDGKPKNIYGQLIWQRTP